MKKNRIATVFAAVTAVFVLVLMPALPASAATVTYDACGTPYFSAPQAGGVTKASFNNSNSFPKAFNCIRWTQGSSILVGGDLTDNESDGLGPTMVVLVQAENDAGLTGSYKYYEARNTEGNGTTRYRSVSIPWPSYSRFGVTIYICNGKSSSGDSNGNVQCGSRHGLFHP